MIRRTRSITLDTHTYTGTRTPELTTWLADTPHTWDGPHLVIHAPDHDVRPQPDWTLAREGNGHVSVLSPDSDQRFLQPHPADRAAVLREAADIADEVVPPDLPRDDREQGRVDAAADIRNWADHIEQDELRRVADEEQPEEPSAVDRAAALREAADFVRGLLLTRTSITTADLEAELRRMADEAQQQGHVYLSTGCYHGDHAYCQAMTGLNGTKRPGQCKHCGARCVCACHQTEAQQQEIVDRPFRSLRQTKEQ